MSDRQAMVELSYIIYKEKEKDRSAGQLKKILGQQVATSNACYLLDQDMEAMDGMSMDNPQPKHPPAQLKIIPVRPP